MIFNQVYKSALCFYLFFNKVLHYILFVSTISLLNQNTKTKGNIMKGILTYNEVNTGGGCMVNIITSTEWDYILVANEDCVTAYASEDAFWDGDDCLAFAPVQMGSDA